jgi:hypothetical protein
MQWLIEYIDNPTQKCGYVSTLSDRQSRVGNAVVWQNRSTHLGTLLIRVASGMSENTIQVVDLNPSDRGVENGDKIVNNRSSDPLKFL